MAAIIGASAMSYSQAREQAWFLTDKMAYELYLTAPQVSAVYEINLDYIMNVDFMGDIFGTYWERRTKELSFVLTRSQMHTFLATEHFYRPISWMNSSFHFVIYDRYPTRTHFYYSAPKVYTTYRGENRKSTTSRFEGKFEDVKPNTGRTLSTRTGVSTTVNKGGFTSENNGTVTNGRTRPSENMGGTGSNTTGTIVTNGGNSSTRNGGTTIRNEATKPSVAMTSSASTIGSTRTVTTRTATVGGSNRSANTSNSTVSGSSRSTGNSTATVSGSSRNTSNGSSTNSARRH